MRMQVILDSSFARPGSAPIWGGKKGSSGTGLMETEILREQKHGNPKVDAEEDGQE